MNRYVTTSVLHLGIDIKHLLGYQDANSKDEAVGKLYSQLKNGYPNHTILADDIKNFGGENK